MSGCPYSKLMNSIPFFGNKKAEVEEEVVTTMDSEKALKPKDIELTECPYKKKTEEKKSESQEKEQNDKQKCPYSSKTVIKDDSDVEDNIPKGGCPVMNTKKKDPANKHFEPAYEINCFGPFDFLFHLRGLLSEEEFFIKTQKLSSIPRHKKYTLFNQRDEKLQKIHEKEFPVVFFAYDDIKEKGNRLFKRGKFREAIQHYSYAYGLLRWIEFKDKKRGQEIIAKPSLDPILDDDIEEKIVYMDDIKVEEDSYQACVVYLLKNLGYAYMELRHFTEAIDCFDEALEVAGDRVPDLYFRRSQARSYNKFSKEEDYELAKTDILKAIELKKDEIIFKEHLDIVNKILEKNFEEKFAKIERILSKAKKSFDKIKQNNLNPDEVIYLKGEDSHRQYKILKDMKKKYSMAIKFFTETKNEEQLEISYKEIESFMINFSSFKFFYKFQTFNIDEKAIIRLPEEIINLLNDETFMSLVDEFKYNRCEDIFSEGDYNFELFQHSMEKIFEEERKEQEEKERIERESKPQVSWFQSIKDSNFGFWFTAIFLIFSVAVLGYQYHSYSSGGAFKFFK